MPQDRVDSTPTYYLSHHKCATMYANRILGRVCGELGLKRETYYRPKHFGEDLARAAGEQALDMVSYLDAEWPYVDALGPVTGVHVIRDPRDVLVSAYFSHRETHQTDSWPELREHREALAEVPKDEGLYLEMEFSSYVYRAMNEWDYEREGLLELRFEELVDDPYTFWLRIVDHLGLLDGRNFGLRRALSYSLQGLSNLASRDHAWWPFGAKRDLIPGGRLVGIIYDHRYSKRTGGRDRGEEDTGSHYRKGVPGDWKNHLTPEHLKEFERRFPGLLEKTGYA